MASTEDYIKQPTDAIGFVFIGPSGSGKSTLRAEICKRTINGHSFVAYCPITTRKPRPSEAEYTYVTDSQFDRMLQTDTVLFSNTSYGNRFLTTWPKGLQKNDHYIYIYLPEAAAKLKRTFTKTKIIQILPPTVSVLKSRIKRRDSGIDTLELTKRLASVEEEIHAGSEIADRTFVNELPLEDSANKLAQLIGILLTEEV